MTRFCYRRPNPVFSDEYRLLRQTLLEARQKAGVSQRSLAARLGRSQSHVVRIEIGQRRVDTLEFYRIARAIGVEPNSLFAEVTRKLAGLEDLVGARSRGPHAARSAQSTSADPVLTRDVLSLK